MERLQTLMRDLLDVTRLEMDALPPRREPIAPSELTEAARLAVAPQAEAKGVELSAEVPAELPPVYADRGQITRALVNLLNNAIRHTPTGGKVTLSASEVLPPPPPMNGGSKGKDTPPMNGGRGGKVAFVVADTGTGIPADYLPHIFERFVQVPGATRGGAGLGLSIVQGIVAAHDGEISATSEQGKGSAFRLTLPTVNKMTEKKTTGAGSE